MVFKNLKLFKNINLNLMNEKLNHCDNIVIRDSKINNSVSYFCEFETVQLDEPKQSFPNCYEELNSKVGTWYKIVKMIPITNYDKFFVLSRTLVGNTMDSVLKSSASSVYFECIDDILI